MSTKKNRKQIIGIPDVWVICGLYALMLLLFVTPGIVINDQPISALTLMRASQLHQYGSFPASMAAARELIALPVLCVSGIVLTLLFRYGTGKYAFGACISMLLFGMAGIYKVRMLSHAGGFVPGTAMFVSAALFFVCIICAVVRRN